MSSWKIHRGQILTGLSREVRHTHISLCEGIYLVPFLTGMQKPPIDGLSGLVLPSVCGAVDLIPSTEKIRTHKHKELASTHKAHRHVAFETCHIH